MSHVTVNAHNISKLMARANEHESCSVLHVTTEEVDIAFFFDDLTMARAYADAINQCSVRLDAGGEQIAEDDADIFARTVSEVQS